MSNVLNPQWVYRDQAKSRLQDAARRHVGGQSGWAKEHGFSPAFVNDVINGRREVSERIGLAIGLQVMTVFYEV